MENLQVQLIRPPMLVRHGPNRRVSVRPAQRRALAFFAFHILSNRVLQLFFKHIRQPWQISKTRVVSAFLWASSSQYLGAGSLHRPTVGCRIGICFPLFPSIALGTGRRPASGMRVPGRPPELACGYGTIRTTSRLCASLRLGHWHPRAPERALPPRRSRRRSLQ